MMTSSWLQKPLITPYPALISSSILLSYFAFYTAYDKSTKQLKLKNLLDLVMIGGGRGLDWSLVELNKALSLSGLTLMLVSFIPQSGNKEDRKEMLWLAMNSLWIHSVYSSYKFLTLTLTPTSKVTIKKLSVFLGAAGQVVLSLGFFGHIDYKPFVALATSLGVAHFWTMEVDYKYKLQVRPYAYLPFGLAAVVLGYLAF